jgi:hypothetical protein
MLKKEAKRLRTSVNMVVLQMIKWSLGFACERTLYHDLDHLAGSWTADEEKIFKENTKAFGKID